MTTHARSTSNGSQLLRHALQLDGIVCLAMGAATAVTAGSVATLMGIPSPLTLGLLGGVLAAYGALLVAAARQESLDRRAAIASLILDLLWVAGSAVLLVSDLLPLTTAGWWIVLVLLLGVAGMAEVKFWGLWRSR